MADLAFTVDVRTGRLDVITKNGAPVSDSSCYGRVMSRLAAIRGAWWADAAGTYGRKQRKNLTRSTPSDLEADVREALAPLVVSGAILPPPGRSDLRVDVTTQRANGSATIEVGWTVPGGGVQSARYALRL